MIDLLEVKRRYEAVLAVEDSRDKILQNLFAQVESLQRALQNTLGDAKFQELKKYKTEYDDLRLDQSKLSFVSVLVDGDCMNFNDALIRQGYNGGRKAAMLLRKSVERHIRDIDPQASPNIQYRIRVYANVPGLMKTYREAHILRSNEALDPFIRGFNMENSLCDFIDAGNGKECSDVKIRATFEQDILDVHCRRIIFCGSTDNGYARILGSHQGSNRISLVQGAPFAWEMEQLASEFQTTSFPEVFRSTKLPSRASSFSAFKTASANSSPSSSPTSLSTPSTPKRNYATIANLTARANGLTRHPGPAAERTSKGCEGRNTASVPLVMSAGTDMDADSDLGMFMISGALRERASARMISGVRTPSVFVDISVRGRISRDIAVQTASSPSRCMGLISRLR
ncbi:CCCH zinc finger DNA binding protein [Aspergillus vadensis CBS 113365]|uniref:CCCH zinc finger DNA binding protein n=1 Tax=Aspergillus vadensis (strain CBS 113365 / IMI 142717 / IBT 24658) TaxID=1448311 RepID=A0A319BAR7_ASPVC|nr:CCCH zinc finger DNA binding protein [Aspergillus vadensis CBS 113365]PYH70076.1 CCCH zinc finger DNA binding protein [Aspergillus vadensis CBS 113365]